MKLNNEPYDCCQECGIPFNDKIIGPGDYRNAVSELARFVREKRLEHIDEESTCTFEELLNQFRHRKPYPYVWHSHSIYNKFKCLLCPKKIHVSVSTDKPYGGKIGICDEVDLDE